MLIFTLFEFLVPLGASIIYLMAIAHGLTVEISGLLIIFNTIGLFFVSLEVMGGRALVGYLQRGLTTRLQTRLIKVGLVFTTLLTTSLTILFFLTYYFVFKLKFLSNSEISLALVLFGFFSVLGQINSYIGWCRLGIGDAKTRSKLLIVSQSTTLFMSLFLLYSKNENILIYASLPFIRELFHFLMNLRFIIKILDYESDYKLIYHEYFGIARDSFLISLSNILFEPLLKIFMSASGQQNLIIYFELILRIISSARNAIYVQFQVRAAELIRMSRTASWRPVKWECWVFFISLLGFLIYYFVLFDFLNLIVPKSSLYIRDVSLYLAPASIIYFISQVRYLGLIFVGKVRLLLCIHLLMGIVFLVGIFLCQINIVVPVVFLIMAAYAIFGLCTYFFSFAID